MFNLVKHRFLFIILSLIVIVPGAISLVLFGLNVGIDFVGGASITLRPQHPITVQEAHRLLDPLKLPDLQVTTGDLGTNNAKQAGNKTVWIRLNTTIDNNVQAYINNTLTQKYAGVQITYPTVAAQGNNKAFTMVVATGFNTTPQVSDIKAALSKIPNTTDTTQQSNGSSGNLPPPAATTTPQATATAQATAKASSTPTVTPTATSTPTTQSAPANIPVSITDITAGTTTNTIDILTSKDVNTDYIWNNIQPQFLSHNGPYVQLISNSAVSGSVAGDTLRNAFFAVIAASLFILAYIWFAFRKVAKPWRYGTCAIIALLHDVLVVLGIFSILGKFAHLQVDALFITALLTVIGFSVHDTIVVFDRIRENMHRRTGESFDEVVNASLAQTLTRSLNTSLTVLLTLLTLTLFSGTGSSIFTFTLTLLIGITSGTYSSIFNASMLLVIWEKGELGFGGFGRKREVVAGKRSSEVRELVRTR